MTSYRRKAFFGIGYLTILNFISQFITLLKFSVLARILFPSDFGLFALVTTTITTFETLTDTGFNYAAIHLGIEIKKIAKTLLAINIARGILLSFCIMATAPLISHFFDVKNLLFFLLLSSTIPFIRGFINPHTINFQKELEFNKVFILQFVPLLANAIFSLFFVIFFHSALALLIGLILSTVCEVLFSYVIAPHTLKGPINKKYLKSLFSYGKWITAGGLLTYLTTQIDNLFIGKFFGPASLGLYNFAYRTANLAFSEITNTVSQVAFPLYSKRKNDKKHLQNLFFKNVLGVTIPAIIITIPFLLFPKYILLILFGNKWIVAAPTLQILAIYGLLRASIGPIGPLFLSVGKPKILTRVNILNLFIVLILIFPLSKLFGLTGVALSMTIAYLLITPVYIIETIKFLRQ